DVGPDGELPRPTSASEQALDPAVGRPEDRRAEGLRVRVDACLEDARKPALHGPGDAVDGAVNMGATTEPGAGEVDRDLTRARVVNAAHEVLRTGVPSAPRARALGPLLHGRRALVLCRHRKHPSFTHVSSASGAGGFVRLLDRRGLSRRVDLLPF